MNLQDLKNKEPQELLKQAEEMGIENPSSFRKQDLMFAILKQIALDGTSIIGTGVIERLQDGLVFFDHLNLIICRAQMISMLVQTKLKNSA